MSRRWICHSYLFGGLLPHAVVEGLSYMVNDVEYDDRKKLQSTYLDGLKRYKNKGVRIMIDGEECPESDWERIFEMGEDGGFYMGDYIGAEQGCLKEIRFDKVYLCHPSQSRLNS